MGSNPNPPTVLTVGNYCHDILIKDDVIMAETLGGAAAFISEVLNGLSIDSDYISKVGLDFKYEHVVKHALIVSKSAKTTLFRAFFTSEPSLIRQEDRVLKRVKSCDPIDPSDLPDGSGFKYGMAVGVGGEIKYETLEKMLELCKVVVVDVQALIRVFDENDGGTVKLVNLDETRFWELVPKIGFLKASADEAEFVDIEVVRKWCCVVVTNAKDGCTVYWKDGEVNVSPFSTVQIDPTGAGDSFLGGLVSGLVEGLSVVDAALLGNFFGSLTVGQVGLPVFDSRLMEKVKEEVHARTLQCNGHDNESRIMKPSGHEQFYASLTAAKLATIGTLSPNVEDQVLDPNPTKRIS